MSRAAGDRPATSRSPIAIVPEVGCSSPATIRSAVDLPHPDGPTSTISSPSATSRSSASTAVVSSPKTFVTDRNSTLAIVSP